jgi:hypothetical protein
VTTRDRGLYQLWYGYDYGKKKIVIVESHARLPFVFFVEIFLRELSHNKSFLHSTNKKMTHVINFKKSVILIKKMET